jgi:Zn-dependent protease with chaperone function
MKDEASKLKGLLWVVAACVVGAGFAFGLAPVAKAIPWSWEKKLGNLLPEQPAYSCHYNSQARESLKKLMARIYPVRPEDSAFSVDVRIAKAPSVNAYAELGGRITVNSGLLRQAQSPEEVAGVIAHEIGHVQNRHIMEGAITHLFTSQGIGVVFGEQGAAAGWANTFLNMGFSRTQEAQADEAGLTRLQDAHVDNKGFHDFFERMGDERGMPKFLSDHPTNDERLEMVESFANKDVKPIMTPEEWKILKAYCNEK